MHTAHINTVITINNLHSAVNSIGETHLAVTCATTACSSKGTNKCSVQASLSHKIATQPAPIEEKEQML